MPFPIPSVWLICMSMSRVRGGLVSVEVGGIAPPLALGTLDGGRVVLAGKRGRTVIVTFLRHAG